MTKEKKQVAKTTAEEIIERIKSLPLDPEYKYDPDVPIPLANGVLVKKIHQTPITTLDSGIVLMEGENTQPPHIGIIQAVGPKCSEFIRIGLRVYYNFYSDGHFRVGGVDYAKMIEHDVFFIIPPKTIVFDGVKSEKQVRKEKKLPEQQAREVRMYKKDQNDKDERLDKTKGKNRFLN